MLSYHFVFILCPVICQFPKNSHFRKQGAKIGFFKFLCFKFIFWKFSFLGLLKHYKNKGFSRILCFLSLKEKKKPEKMIIGISGFGFFCPKMAVSWRASAFQKKLAETPILIVFLSAHFWAKVPKKGNFGHSPKKGKNWPITEKLCFGGFLLFFFVFLCFVMFLGCFFWRV